MKRLWFFLMTLFFLAAPHAAENPLVIKSAYLVSSSDNIQLKEVASFPNDALKTFHKDLRLGFIEKPVWIKLRIVPKSSTSFENASTIGYDSAVVLRIGLLAHRILRERFSMLLRQRSSRHYLCTIEDRRFEV